MRFASLANQTYVGRVISSALFDNDDTLYKPSGAFKDAIREKSIIYLSRMLGLTRGAVLSERERLAKKYRLASTVVLFALGYGIGTGHEFDRMVSETYLQVDPRDFGVLPDHRLSDMLAGLPIKKSIFTNNPSGFAASILNVLEVSQYFERVVGPSELGFLAKPSRMALLNALRVTRYTADSTILIEDDIASVKTAQRVGLAQVLVGTDDGAAEISIPEIYDLRKILR